MPSHRLLHKVFERSKQSTHNPTCSDAWLPRLHPLVPMQDSDQSPLSISSNLVITLELRSDVLQLRGTTTCRDVENVFPLLAGWRSASPCLASSVGELVVASGATCDTPLSQ